MGGQIFDPGGTGTIGTGEAPSPDGSTPTQPASGATYVKIVVPAFNGNDVGGSPNPMASYLRIGAIEPDITPGQSNATAGSVDHTGEDLAGLVQGFADDLRVRTTSDVAEITALSIGAISSDIAAATNVPPAERLPHNTTAPSAPGPALDPATSVSGGQFPGTVTNRLAESNRLHLKGGWRDHSDGNRITTTRGDKVEVIQGNYKMVVLGRQFDATGMPDVASATGWDMSGGLVDSADLSKSTAALHRGSNAYSVDYTWEKDSDGVWGWTQTTMIGSPVTSQNPSGMGNGKLLSFTWADEIQTFIGGPAPSAADPSIGILGILDVVADGDVSPKPVNLFKTRTWANTVDQKVRSSGTFDNVSSSGGKMTTTLHSDGEMDNITSSSGHMSNQVSGSDQIWNQMTSPSDITTLQAAGALIAQMAFSTTQASLNVSLAIANVTIAAMLFELKSWIHVDMHVGTHADMHMITHMDLHYGPHVQMDAMPTFRMGTAPGAEIAFDHTHAYMTRIWMGMATQLY